MWLFKDVARFISKDRWECTFHFLGSAYRAPAKIRNLESWNQIDDLFLDFIIPCEDMRKLAAQLAMTHSQVCVGVLENDVDRYDINKMTPLRLESSQNYFRMWWGCKDVTLLEK